MEAPNIIGKLKSNFGGTEFQMFDLVDKSVLDKSVKTVNNKTNTSCVRIQRVCREAGNVQYDHFLQGKGSPISLKIMLPNQSFYCNESLTHTSLNANSCPSGGSILKRYKIEKAEKATTVCPSESKKDIVVKQENEIKQVKHENESKQENEPKGTNKNKVALKQENETELKQEDGIEANQQKLEPNQSEQIIRENETELKQEPIDSKREDESEPIDSKREDGNETIDGKQEDENETFEVNEDELEPTKENETELTEDEAETIRNENYVNANMLAMSKLSCPVKRPLDEEFEFETPNQQIECYENLRPIWHDGMNAYTLHFDNRRVREKSVKNFKLVRSNDAEKYTILQFGRVVDRNVFIMDFRYPLSPLQAFQICLSSIDPKLAV